MSDYSKLVEILKKEFSGIETHEKLLNGVYVTPELFKKVASYCNKNNRFKMNVLNCLTGVDYVEHLEVVYHLVSYLTKDEIILKVKLNKNKPEIDSVQDIWGCANWHERECHDLLGIKFLGHPNLTRLLLPDDWEGYPLRKDYVEPTEYHGIQHSRPKPLLKNINID